MTSIDAIAANPSVAIDDTAQGAQSTTGSNSQIGEQTFLQLLVAQMQYQDPMNPTDSTQFLTQTAQFTEVESLNNIESEIKAQEASSEVLEAGSMIGKDVSVATPSGTPAVSTVTNVGGNLSVDDSVGSTTSTTATLYTSKGTQEPLRLQFTRMPDGSDGSKHWQARAFVSTTPIAGPFNVDFDASGNLTSGDITLTSTQLDQIPDSSGEWDPNGVRLNLGTSNDSTRLKVGSGADSLTSFGGNGTDGQSVSGVVTGVEFTANGPLLTINNQQYQLSDVTNMNVS